MVRFRPEDCAIDRATDRHGIYGGAMPLLAGGVYLIDWRGSLFHDLSLRHALTDERRLRAHLEFQQRVLQIAIPELFSQAKSPVDLFKLIYWDRFHRDRIVDHIVLLRHTRHDGTCPLLQQAAIDDDGDGASIGTGTAVNNDGGGRGGVEAAIDDHNDQGISGIEVDRTLIMRYMPDSTIRKIESDQKMLYTQLCDAQRHFAYRRLFVKLDFIQSHMNFLQKHEQSKIETASGTSKYESAALENINSELSSTLQRHLDHYDWLMMEQYYDRMKFRRLARECATHAQTIGVILVGEALPVNPEVRALPLIKQIQGKFRSGGAAGRPWHWRLLALGTLATVATTGGLSSNVSYGWILR